MALVVKDRVKETSTTTGTGGFTLAGAVDGFQSFATALSNGDTTYYAITDAGTGDFEVGLGSYNAGVLTRTTILESSNTGSAVNFGAGEKEVFITYPAEKAVYLDASNNITVPGLVDGRDIAADGSKLDGIEAGATADQTAGEIKTAYESNADTNAYTDAEKSKLAGVEAGATADQTAAEILTAIKTVDGAASGLDADLLDGNHASAFATAAQGSLADSAVQPGDNISTLTNNSGYITGNQTITLSGDVSGSGTTSITVTVADDSHNHIISNVDGLQTALNNKLETSLKGAANGLAELDATGKVPSAQLPSYVDDVLEYTAAGSFPGTGETGKLYVALDTNDVYRWTGSAYVKVSDAVSTADQATKLATARNIALGGDVSGSANFDGSANITITATVADDSHNHVISNVDGLQAALDAKADDTTTISAGSGLTGGGSLAANRTISHADTSTQASVNNSNGTVIQDVTLDTYGHVTSLASIDLDGRYYTESEADSRFVNLAGATMTGDLLVQDDIKATGMVRATGWWNTNTGTDGGDLAVEIGVSSGEGYILSYNRNTSSYGDLNLTANNIDLAANNGATSVRVNSNIVFHDGYHPNADKWTTARTLSLSGDASGSVSWDGSANATLSVTVANDSHTHDGRYYTESEANSLFVARDFQDSSRNLNIATNSTSNAMGLFMKSSSGAFGFQLYGDGSNYGFLSSDWGAWDIQKVINGQFKVNEGSGLQRVFNDGYHPNADAWTTSRTITLAGDLSGSVSIDGSANVTLTATVADDSHTHDGRYYTESEADSRFVNVTGDIMTGNLEIQGLEPKLILSDTNNSYGGGAQIGIEFDTTGGVQGFIGQPSSSNNTIYITNKNGSSNSLTTIINTGGGDIVLEPDSGSAYVSSNKIFHDGYHPNADKLTTARNIALTGAVTGNANFDGSGNISIATTATADPTLTINGDASGSATFTNLGNATLTLTIADDSHNHTIANVDGLQTALDGKLSTSGKAADSNLLDGIDSSSFLRSDQSGTLNGILTVTNNSNPAVVIRDTGNAGTAATPWVQFKDSATADLGYVGFGSSASNDIFLYTNSGNPTLGGGVSSVPKFYQGGTYYNIWHQGNDGSGSGLDADLLDGLQLHTGRNNEANKVVRTDGSGYIQAGWINTTSGSTTSIDRIYASYDGYIRYVTPATLRSQVTDGYYYSPSNPPPAAGAVPAGVVVYHAGSTAPSGYLKANGAAVSRTTYSALFSAIGTTYGAGNGSTTFNLPDLRGEFLRGWDDARGVDSGRTFGSSQGDAIRDITGQVTVARQAFNTSISASGAFSASSNITGGSWDAYAFYGGTRIDFKASNSVTTASENRPRNIALLACIKY